jgi:hypothetical protein
MIVGLIEDGQVTCRRLRPLAHQITQYSIRYEIDQIGRWAAEI